MGDADSFKVEMTALPYFVATLASDQKWYVRASFSSMDLAKAYAMGMESVGVKTRILSEDRRPEKDPQNP